MADEQNRLPIRNFLLMGTAAGLVVWIWWGIHTSGPRYKAEQRLNEARQRAAEGKPLEAARLFLRVMDGGYFIEESKVGYRRVVEPLLAHTDADERLSAFKLLSGQHRVKEHFPELVERALALAIQDVDHLAKEQPEKAYEVFLLVRLLNPKDPSLPALEQRVLQSLDLTDPENLPFAIMLALIYEKDDRLEDVGKLLAPHREKLGVTEGARLLGRVRLSQGDHEGAFQLLRPYVKSKMEQLRQTERSYTNTLDVVSKEAIKRLEDGQASPDWYQRYDAASETEQGRMVDEYVGTFMRNDPRYQREIADMTRANDVVAVAIDLGVAQLNRAQGITDPTSRKAAFGEARDTFISIQSFAGQSNDYLLFMGQVNYWLGNAEEGRKQFEQLMTQAQGNAFNILLAVANSVREVGDVNWARELVEEAYTGTIRKEEMSRAARQRALMSKDTDDQIKWLELSDPEAADTIIALNSARGRKAMEDDDKTEAARYYREAVRGYEKLPRNASTLNNKALAYQDLYSVSGSVAEFMHGVELMNEATKLSPEDAILTINSASVAFTAAYFELLTNHLDFSVLKSRPDIATVSLLFENDTERRKVHGRLRESKTFKKAVTQLDRAMVLSPKRVNGYVLRLEISRALRDLDALKQLSQQVATAEPDVELLKESYLNAYRPDTEPAKTIKGLRNSLAKVRQDLAGLKDRKSPTAVMLRIHELSIQQSLAREGAEQDLTKLIAASRELVRDADNRSTRGHLSQVLCLQALRELLAAHPSLVAEEKRTRNLFSSANFLIHVLERGGPPAGFIAENAAAKEAAALYQQIQDQFPARPSPQSWALIRHFDPVYARAMIPRMKADEVSALADELRHRLVPHNTAGVLTQYHRQLACGDVPAAQALYRAAIERGVPLPAL